MIDPGTLDWAKMGGLLPAVIQDEGSGQVLMLGYMDRQALAASLETGFVTFFSRSRQMSWVKGQTSGNRLVLISAHGDCDADSLLILARPEGPTCHLGKRSCFGEEALPGIGFLARLEETQAERGKSNPAQSYTARLLSDGIKRIAQKVGEEGVETALAGIAGTPEELTAEAADLIYHLLLLLRTRESSLAALVAELRRRYRDNRMTTSS